MVCALRHRLDNLAADANTTWSPAYRRRLANRVLAQMRQYPDQQALARDLSASVQNVAVYGTRRSGKTDGIMRWALASLIARDNFTVRILTNTLHAPTENILARKQDGGMVALLDDLGLVRPVCKVVRVSAKQSVVEISFAWGSSLTVSDIGSVRAIDNKHGFTGDVFWIDELTKTPLAEFALANLVNPVLGDSEAIVVVSYTPDEELDSLASVIAQHDTAYRRHHFRSWRNPFFGATFDARWKRLVDTLAKSRDSYRLTESDIERLRNLSEGEADSISLSTDSGDLEKWVDGLDPELLRNFFGRWVRMANAHVYYPFHRLPNDILYWYAVDIDAARNHKLPDGALLPVARTMQERVDILPEYPREGRRRGWYEWRATIGADIGYRPDPYAVVVRVWSNWCPRVYELYSYKEHEMDDDVMFDHLFNVVREVRALRVREVVGRETIAHPIPIDAIVADLTGMREGTRRLWDRRIRERIPELQDVGIVNPKKPEVLPRIRAHNMDILAGRHRYGAGGCISVEGKHLRYKKDKPNEVHKQREVTHPDGSKDRPGDHASDACMYADHIIPVLYSTEPPKRAASKSTYFSAMDNAQP